MLLIYQGGRRYDGFRGERSQPDDLYLLTELARDLAYVRYTTSIEIADSSVDVTATAAYHRLSEQATRAQVAFDRVDRFGNRDDVLALLANVRADLGRGGRFSAGLEGYFDWVASSAEHMHRRWERRQYRQPRMATLSRWIGGPWLCAVCHRRAGLGTPVSRRAEQSARSGQAAGVGARRGNFLIVGADDRLSRLFPSLKMPQGGSSIDVGLFRLTASALRVCALAPRLLPALCSGTRPASLDDQARRSGSSRLAFADGNASLQRPRIQVKRAFGWLSANRAGGAVRGKLAGASDLTDDDGADGDRLLYACGGALCRQTARASQRISALLHSVGGASV